MYRILKIRGKYFLFLSAGLVKNYTQKKGTLRRINVQSVRYCRFVSLSKGTKSFALIA